MKMANTYSSKTTARIIGIVRHRIGTDGKGVSTLVGFSGCPLRCKYCINPQCFDSQRGTPYTARGLYDTVKKDDLYFVSSGGGVCFGGGEPLLHTDFIRDFCKLAPKAWRITAETSLNIPRENLIAAVGCIDDFFIDIKDTNPEIYRDYTDADNTQVLENLRLLVSMVSPERITVRIPLIKDYNTAKDRENSTKLLKSIGIVRFDVFEYNTDIRAKKEVLL